jgi:hypothetical protein
MLLKSFREHGIAAYRNQERASHTLHESTSDYYLTDTIRRLEAIGMQECCHSMVFSSLEKSAMQSLQTIQLCADVLEEIGTDGKEMMMLIRKLDRISEYIVCRCQLFWDNRYNDDAPEFEEIVRMNTERSEMGVITVINSTMRLAANSKYFQNPVEIVQEPTAKFRSAKQIKEINSLTSLPLLDSVLTRYSALDFSRDTIKNRALVVISNNIATTCRKIVTDLTPIKFASFL